MRGKDKREENGTENEEDSEGCMWVGEWEHMQSQFEFT